MDNPQLDPSQIQQMITLLQSMLQTSGVDTNKNEEEFSIKQKSTKERRSKKKNKQTQSSNKFLDMPEMHMHKEDVAIDKKLIVKPPVPRTRKFEFIEAICTVCGKRDKVSPVLVQSRDRYKCNKCSTSAG